MRFRNTASAMASVTAATLAAFMLAGCTLGPNDSMSLTGNLLQICEDKGYASPITAGWLGNKSIITQFFFTTHSSIGPALNLSGQYGHIALLGDLLELEAGKLLLYRLKKPAELTGIVRAVGTNTCG